MIRLPLTTLAPLLTLGLTAQAQDSDASPATLPAETTTEEAVEITEEATEAAEEATEASADAAKATEETAEAVEEAAEEATDALEEAVGSAEEAAEAGTEEAADATEEAVETAGETVDTTEEAIAELERAAEEAIAEEDNDASQTGEEPAADAEEAAEDEEAGTAEEAEPPPLDPTMHSYYLGYVAASQLQQRFGFEGLNQEDFDREAIAEGFLTSISGGQPDEEVYPQERLEQALTAFDALVTERATEAEQAFLAAAEAAAAEGEAYLEENAAKEGVSVTESGLQYEVLEAGEGEPIGDEGNQLVSVHYQGSLTDGTVFDGNMDDPEPAVFPLQGVVPGFAEGLKLMPVGARYRFVIPSELAYGTTGSPPRIPGNSVLTFEVVLDDVQEAPAPQLPGGIDPSALPQTTQPAAGSD